jgi:gliding motility-associated-like protein
VNDAAGCAATGTVTFNPSAAATVILTPTNPTCTANGQITAMGTGQSPIAYAWSNAQTTATIANLDGGTFTVTVTDAGGCSATASTTLTAPQPATINAGQDVTINAGQSTNLSATPNNQNSNYAWSNNSNGATITVNPTTTTTYTVTVTTALGCTATDAVIVNVLTTAIIQFPNVFTPNGDGQNDTFFYVADVTVDVDEFRVYNRWGQLVHNSNKAWDGKFDGTDQPMDTYIYTIVYRQPNGTVEQKSGDITLIR